MAATRQFFASLFSPPPFDCLSKFWLTNIYMFFFSGLSVHFISLHICILNLLGVPFPNAATARNTLATSIRTVLVALLNPLQQNVKHKQLFQHKLRHVLKYVDDQRSMSDKRQDDYTSNIISWKSTHRQRRAKKLHTKLENVEQSCAPCAGFAASLFWSLNWKRSGRDMINLNTFRMDYGNMSEHLGYRATPIHYWSASGPLNLITKSLHNNNHGGTCYFLFDWTIINGNNNRFINRKKRSDAAAAIGQYGSVHIASIHGILKKRKQQQSLSINYTLIREIANRMIWLNRSDSIWGAAHKPPNAANYFNYSANDLQRRNAWMCTGWRDFYAHKEIAAQSIRGKIN